MRASIKERGTIEMKKRRNNERDGRELNERKGERGDTPVERRGGRQNRATAGDGRRRGGCYIKVQNHIVLIWSENAVCMQSKTNCALSACTHLSYRYIMFKTNLHFFNFINSFLRDLI